MTRRLLELTIEDVAGRAGVDLTYIRRLIDLGALGPEGDGFREQDVHVTALLHMWEDAGLTAESILTAVEAGELSLDFLESPGWELPPRLDRTYRQLAEERGMPVELLLAVHRSTGFVPPDPDDLAGPDDAVIASRTTTKNEGSQSKGNPEPKQQVSGRFEIRRRSQERPDHALKVETRRVPVDRCAIPWQPSARASSRLSPVMYRETSGNDGLC